MERLQFRRHFWKTGAIRRNITLRWSGLSRNDRVSPETILHVLFYNFASKNRDAFINSSRSPALMEHLSTGSKVR